MTNLDFVLQNIGDKEAEEQAEELFDALHTLEHEDEQKDIKYETLIRVIEAYRKLIQ